MKDTSIRAQFQRFLKKNNLNVAFIMKLAHEYAYTDNEVAKSYFTEKYNISDHTFYACRNFAVICYLVDNKTSRRIKKKTAENYRSHNEKNTSQASTVHFKKLEDKQKQFLSEFTNAEIQDIAKSYADGVSVDKICSQYFTGRTAINLLLYKGVTNFVVDKKTLDAILKLAPNNSSFIDKMLDVRKKRKEQLLSAARHEKDLIDFKIKNYDTYFMFDKEEDKPSLEDLRLEGRKANIRYGKIFGL